MQGKGLIKLILVLLLLVCLFQFFYFIPTGRVERDADNYAQEMSANLTGADKAAVEKDARAKYLDSMSSETILSIPLIAKYTYNDLKSQQLALGLDLKGGMSSVLEVDLQELLVALAGRNAKDVDFVAALEAAKKAQLTEQSDYVSLFVREFRKIAPNRKLATIFQQSETLEDINLDTSDGEVEKKLREKADQTVDLTYKMLKERIDRLGVVQPNVSLDENRDLILVEMPGIDNPQRARQYLSQSAKLEFWETYRFTDNGILSSLQEADRRLKGISDTTVVDSASLNAVGPLLSALQLNGQNGVQYPQTVVGVADKNKTKVISEMLERPEIASLFPKNLRLLWGYKPYQDPTTRNPTGQYELYAIKTQPNTDNAPIDGDVVTSAGQTQDQITGEPQVNLTMNAAGAKKWAELTGKAYNGNAEGNRREIAIVLDEQVVTAPSVNTGAITGGSSVISGSFNVQEAIDLSNILEVGKLPAKTKIIQEAQVGPTLGKQNIQKSTLSLVLGFLLVLGFMIFYYAKGGVVSVLALLLNIILIFGTLSSFGTVLTLPGIAGIVLTIGMAVDANVIIFERIREELRAGKTMLQSISDGFTGSYSSIIDANVTTILTAIVLAYFGLGPIKGFAVVLIVGVISSMFTAVVVGKFFIDSYVKDGERKMSFWTGVSKESLANLNFDWVGKRKYAYMFSGILIAASLISIAVRGFELGVDFTGGYSYNVQLDGAADINSEKLRQGLKDVFGSVPVVKQIDANNTFNIITSYNINDTGEGADEKVSTKLYEGLKAITGSNTTYEAFKNSSGSDTGSKIMSFSKVGPTIADDIKKSSFYAGMFALILIFIYIFIRFSKWQYSMGAIIALFHDTIITLGIFSMLYGWAGFSLEIDQAFIAAILTVIGYSINDTVIVFDRIREYFGLYPNKTKDEVINDAINQTFSRTTITSMTTLFVVLVLFLFGGSSIKGFAFAILVGILVGTYSSIFVATPIVRDLTDDISIQKRVSPAKTAKAVS
ncbi:MAG: protein translocase subunit SecD [Saprospiraceae bacterium]|nr:protein translocase subunit SecD [Saprospiraceae bacterium]